MKCPSFELMVYSDAHKGFVPSHKILYIPKRGVLAYDFDNKRKRDCLFFNDAESIRLAEKLPKKNCPNSKYLGKTEISEDEINEFLASSKGFQKKASGLVSRIQ